MRSKPIFEGQIFSLDAVQSRSREELKNAINDHGGLVRAGLDEDVRFNLIFSFSFFPPIKEIVTKKNEYKEKVTC